MSMISEQVDRLRKVAQVERDLGRHEFEQVLLDAADTIWELSGRLTHWELHECPACKNVADLQAALDENAKLRELVLDMHGFIERMDEEYGDVTFSDCFYYCKHETTDDGCCKTGECWYEQRMREIGLEVE